MQSLPRFQLNNSGEDDDERYAIYFTGEMVSSPYRTSVQPLKRIFHLAKGELTIPKIYQDMFEDYVELRKLRETAELVAKIDDWPDLYDEEQLAKNEVPLYAVTYVDDMYVDYEFAQETASKIKNCKQFITNTMYHSGLTHQSNEVMKQLFALRDDVID